jgi:hypothetical protein
MTRADRIARLFWFIVTLALIGLTLLALLALLGMLASPLLGVVALAIVAVLWWMLIRAVRRIGSMSSPNGVTLRLVRLSIQPDAPTASSGSDIAKAEPALTAAQLDTFARTSRVPVLLSLLGLVAFAASLGLFAFTRFAFIADYPIYFFSDEAIHTVHATDLLRNGLRGADGDLLPAYFPNGRFWNLSLSVYVQTVAVALFGKSVEVVRLTSAAFAVLGALAAGLMMKLVFKQRFYWSVVLFLAATPAWFLHSRTAFETALMVSCYSGFMLFYLLYRYRAPWFLFPALICGAATFYAYANGQAVMLVTGVLLILSDLRYHVKHWRTALLGVGLIVLLALPYARFRLAQPDALTTQLRVLDSYLFDPIPLADKVIRFLSEYAYGLSPLYWFLPNDTDLARHVMKGYGHILIWTLPFFVIGLAVCIRNFKSAMHRAVLIALLAAPFGSALAEIAVTRALLFVLPAAMLSAIGLEWLLNLIRAPQVRALAASAASVILAVAGVGLWRDALLNGPTWFTDYGLYGMQWGARQLLGRTVPDYLRANPDRILYLSPTWSNGTDVLMRFFDLDPARVQGLNIDHFLLRQRPLDARATFVMPPDEAQRADESGRFKPMEIEGVISAPDGSDAFFFARLAYKDDIEAIFAREAAERQKPVTDTVQVGDAPVLITHSRLDMGKPQDMFDGDTFTLARGESANPFVIELAFDPPRPMTGVDVVTARMDFALKAVVTGQDGKTQTYAGDYRGLPGEPLASMFFRGAPKDVTRLRLEITQLDPPEDVHIHVREVTIK